MGVSDFDPYLWLENLNDPNVVQWALDRSEKARKVLEPLSRKLMPRISKYYSLPYVISVDIGKYDVFMLLRDGKSFKIGKITEEGSFNEIVKSEDIGEDVVIQGFQLSEEGDKLAFSFSIGGADEGVTRILDVKSNEVLMN